MTYPVDLAAQNAALDALLGSGHAAGVPSSWEVALFAGDPTNGGTELTSAGGYARVTVSNDTAHWPAASGGMKSSMPINFPTPTAAWSDVATHFLLISAADHSTQWFPGLLSEPVGVFGTELGVSVSLSLYWNTEL